MIEQVKKHGPLAAVGALAVFALLRPPETPSSPATSATITTAAGSAVPAQAAPQSDAVTRLVSCGDMRGSDAARVGGDDRHGSITLGPGAGGKCTLVFGARWTARPTCMVVGGRIAKLTATDLVIEGAKDVITYDCGPVTP